MEHRPKIRLAAAIIAGVFVVSCGTGGTGSVSPRSAIETATVACVPVSGQQTQPPYFIGQTLQCTATSNGAPVSVHWGSSSGVIDVTGLITKVTDPTTVSINGASTSATNPINAQTLNIGFVKPSGAPGLVFSVPAGKGVSFWDFVIDDSGQLHGAGWLTGANPQAQLFTMDFWLREPRYAVLSQPSLLTAATFAGKHALFAGATIGASSYLPLAVSSDSTPSFLTLEECPTAGILTAVAVDDSNENIWGAWSGDTGASRIQINDQSYRLGCNSGHDLVSSTSTQKKVPWVWSLHAIPIGTIAAGHYITADQTIGFVTINDQNGTRVVNQEFANLADVRVTPTVYENGTPFFYLAGHDISNADDVWTVKKLDASLEPLWTWQWKVASGKSEPLSIVPNPNGGVILGGKATQITTAGGDANLTDAILLSINKSGNTQWGPIRMNPSNSGSDACAMSSVRLTPDLKFLVAAVGCGQATIDSYLLGFALP
jgi:hypothetical protein